MVYWSFFFSVNDNIEKLNSDIVKTRIISKLFSEWGMKGKVKVRLAPNIFDLAPNFQAPELDVSAPNIVQYSTKFRMM